MCVRACVHSGVLRAIVYGRVESTRAVWMECGEAGVPFQAVHGPVDQGFNLGLAGASALRVYLFLHI